MKRLFAAMLVCALLMSCIPGFASAKQMNDGVPEWNEETVRQYALDYIAGTDMDRLWGYYDLQIRRYMPPQTFEALLVDLHFMTGDFIELGSYRSFEEPSLKLKTHVLHLCMEKQDLELYFTHKNKEDDWEIMAVEFVPAAEELVSDGSDMLVENHGQLPSKYVDESITIGTADLPLPGILSMPVSASADHPVPACILVHDFDAGDMNATLGQTALFTDLSDLFAKAGIAVLRYSNRTFTYPDAKIETVWDEVVEDALSGIELLKNDKRIDKQRIVVVGVGFGAMLAPRIASQSDKAVTALMMIGGSTDSLVNIDYEKNKAAVAVMGKEEAEEIKNAVRKMHSMKETKAREVNLFGHNGYYYWEADEYDPIKLIKSMKLQTFIAHGKRDAVVPESEGIASYKKQIGLNAKIYTYESFRGLNHLLMRDLTTNDQGIPAYEVEDHLDLYAGQTLASWILNLYSEQ